MNALRKPKPQLAVAMSDEAREDVFRQASSLQSERAFLKSATIKGLVALGATGWGVAGIVVVAAASLLPLKTHEVVYFAVDQTTSWVGPAVPVSDAPTLFHDATIEGALLSYVEFRENYVYESDDLSFKRVALMSTPEEQVRYKAMHDDPKAPYKAWGNTGQIRVDNFRISKIGDGKFGSMIYLVRFDRREIKNNSPVPTRGEPYAVTITFSFHPEYPMTPDDRRKNPTGLQVSAYQFNADLIKDKN